MQMVCIYWRANIGEHWRAKTFISLLILTQDLIFRLRKLLPSVDLYYMEPALQRNKFMQFIGNSMVSSAIWKKTCTSEFFKDDRNCTSPKDECNLKSLKNSRVYVFPNCTRKHTITY